MPFFAFPIKGTGLVEGSGYPFGIKWLPGTNPCENEFPVERPIKPAYLAVPDLQKAPIGVRLRFLRKRRGLTIPELEKATGVGHNAISALERGAVPPKPWVLGPILAFYGQDAAPLFPGEGDIFDRVLPPTNLGAWLANFRLRKGLQLKDLARVMKVSKVAVWRYERNLMRPSNASLHRLRKAYKLKGELDRFPS